MGKLRNWIKAEQQKYAKNREIYKEEYEKGRVKGLKKRGYDAGYNKGRYPLGKPQKQQNIRYVKAPKKTKGKKKQSNILDMDFDNIFDIGDIGF